MTTARLLRASRALLSLALALAVVAMAPNLASYEAAAQVFTGASAGSAVSGVGAAAAAPSGSPLSSAPSLPAASAFASSLNSGLALPVAPGLRALAAPGAAVAAAPAAPGALPAAAALPSAAAGLPALPLSAAIVGAAPQAEAAVAAPAAPATAAPISAPAPAPAPGAAAVSARAGSATQLAAVSASLAAAHDDDSKAGAFGRTFDDALRAMARYDEPAHAATPSSVSGPAAQPASAALAAPGQRPGDSSPAVASAPTVDAPVAVAAQRGGALRAALSWVSRAIGWNAPTPSAPAPDDPINVKTLVGLVLQSLPSMAAYMLVTLAFVAVAVPVVGWGGYGILMSLSPMAGIAAANIMGNAVKHMSARNAMALNTLLRVVSLMALPTFHFFGLVNMGTLLVGAMAEGFLLSSIMTTQGSFLRVLFPAKQLGNINGALFMMFPAVQMVLGLFLGIGRVADMISPFLIFAGAAAINLFLVLPLVWATIPNIKLAQGASAPSAPKAPLLSRVGAFLKKYWKEAALLVAAVGLFAGLTWGLPALAPAAAAFVTAHHLSAPLPIAAALMWWIMRTDGYRQLKSGETAEASADPQAGSPLYRGRQLRSIALMALSTVMYYPLYLVATPSVAAILAGAAHKNELAGQFLGALFFGSMISTSARTKLPEVRIPLPGGRKLTIGVHRMIQATVAALGGLWFFTKLFPGNILLALAGAAVAAGLIALTSRVNERGWIKLAGVGFAAIWLPFAVWTWPALIPFLTVKTAMYLALFAAGIVNGPAFVTLITYLYRNTKPNENSKVGGIQGASFNAAISLGYGLLTIASGFVNPAYPAVLAVLGVINLLIGGLFWRAPRSLPGLPQGLFTSRAKPADAAKPAEKK